jgi:hypothetical protein
MAVAELIALEIGDPPALWEELGFAVAGGVVWIDGIACRLGAPGRGVLSWTLEGALELIEVPVGQRPPPRPVSAPEHPNGVMAIDHIVVRTPDLGRTTTAFEAAGIECRRIRETGTGDRPAQQAFFRLGGTIAEVVGPPRPAGDGAAGFYGLAFTVGDLGRTAAFLGPHLRPAKPAVQPDRRIATLDRSAGSSVAIAFMSPEPRRGVHTSGTPQP